VVSAAEALALVRDGDTVASSGFVGIGFAENLAVALEQRFLATGTARADAGLRRGQGDGKERGLNHLGHEGLVARVIGGHWGLVPSCRSWPWTTASKPGTAAGRDLAPVRDIAAQTGQLSRVGLGTFVDPRHGGGRINARTTEDWCD